MCSNPQSASGTVFKRTVAEIKEIVEVCKENGIEVTGNVFNRTAVEIKEIVEVCKKNGICALSAVWTGSCHTDEKFSCDT